MSIAIFVTLLSKDQNARPQQDRNSVIHLEGTIASIRRTEDDRSILKAERIPAMGKAH